MIVNRLPQILAERDLSIRELARKTDITYSTIWSVVHSQRRSVQLGVLEAICLVLAIQPGDIYLLVSDDVPLAPISTKNSSFEDKKAKHLGQDLKERKPEISADRNQPRGEPDSDWRFW